MQAIRLTERRVMAATATFGVPQPRHTVCVEDEAFTGGLKVRILAWER